MTSPKSLTASLMLRIRQRSRQRWLADGALLTVAAIWGSTFFLIKDATANFSVFAFLLIRFAIGSVALLPLAIVEMRRRGQFPRRSDWMWGIAGGVIFFVAYVFQTSALRLIDSGRAGFVTGLYVILVPVVGLVLFHTPIHRRVIVGGILALIGMVLLGYAPGGTPLGDLLALMCALCYAGHILLIERMPRHADWRFLALSQSLTVAVLALIFLPILAAVHTCSTPLCQAFAPFADPLPTTIPDIVWFAAAFTGLLATAFGLMVQVWAQRILPANDAALIFALESPFSVLFGVTFRGEVLTTLGLVGCGLIFSGTITVTVGQGAEAVKAGDSLTP
ncbi:MAG: DMT family transporter [Anaerolineae bacterium]